MPYRHWSFTKEEIYGSSKHIYKMIGGKIGQEIIWFTHVTCDKLTKSITALSVVMLHFFFRNDNVHFNVNALTSVTSLELVNNRYLYF